MPKDLILEEIIRKNPNVDLYLLDEGAKLLEELRSLGFSKKGYDLALPSTRRRSHVLDDPLIDPRAVHLKR